MKNFVIGQRYMSLGEPNLGLGILEELADKNLSIFYPASGERRRYGLKTAPLKRIIFDIGDEVHNREGFSFIVKDRVLSDSGLYVYRGEAGEELIEIDLLDSIQYHQPEEKIFNELPDSFNLFLLRQESFKFLNWLEGFSLRGMQGGRLSLIDHQYYLADKVLNQPFPRVLLADEVGLGKTIEAGLILKSLIQRGRADRVLVVTPGSLNFQWFIEMYRKYNITFTVINENSDSAQSETQNPFDENNFVISSLELLTGSEKARNMAIEANWDLMIVDEAHKLYWKADGPSKQYSVIEDLAARIPGLVLLTATPEIYGQAGHFARLRLLDPDRFNSFKEYTKEQGQYQKLADIVKVVSEGEDLSSEQDKLLNELGVNSKKLLETNFQELIDRHGPGRVYFRNTRKTIDEEFKYFPKRVLYPYKLNSEKKNIKLEWLSRTLEENRDKKFLLISRTKEDILKIENYLKNHAVNNKIGLFHEDLSLMARDRQAAFFQDPDGANILLCSEIGSEGRNFQFCHNLILFDLPSTVDLVEQRIGRLDRIGQKFDVNIHIPFIAESSDEVLFRYYDEVFEVFSKSVPSGNFVHQKVKDQLHKYLENPGFEGFEELLVAAKNHYQEFLESLEKGRDILVEINSFDRESAKALTDKIKKLDQDDGLRNYLEKVFSEFGVDVDDLDDDSQFIKPGDNMFVPHFPGLNSEGFSFTYSRQKACEREELAFMTWDHDLVGGSLDLITGEDFGNASIAVRKNGKVNPFFEFFFLLKVVAPKSLEVGRFFPPTIIRVLLSSKGEDFSEKWSFEELNPKLEQANSEIIQKVGKSLSGSKGKFKDLQGKAKSIAMGKAEQTLNQALENVRDYYTQELDRLFELQKVNPLVNEGDIDLIKRHQKEIEDTITRFSLDLDSLRFIY